MPFIKNVGGTLASGSGTSGGGSGGTGNTTTQMFADTLDSGGEKAITGLTNADTGKVTAIITGNPTFAGSLTLLSRTSTSLTFRSTAGSKHSGATFEGKLTHTS